MRTSVAVIDSGPLLCIVHVGLEGSLGEFFDQILVPSVVQREVSRKHRFRRKLKKLYEQGTFTRCAMVDPPGARLHTYDYDVVDRIDPGEAEALAQAQEQGARFVLVDDLRARKVIEGGVVPLGETGS